MPDKNTYCRNIIRISIWEYLLGFGLVGVKGTVAVAVVRGKLELDLRPRTAGTGLMTTDHGCWGNGRCGVGRFLRSVVDDVVVDACDLRYPYEGVSGLQVPVR